MDEENNIFINLKSTCECILQKMHIHTIGNVKANRQWDFGDDCNNVISEKSCMQNVLHHSPKRSLEHKSHDISFSKPPIEIVKDKYLDDILSKLRLNHSAILERKAKKEWHDTKCTKCRFIRKKFDMGCSFTSENKGKNLGEECLKVRMNYGDLFKNLSTMEENDFWNVIDALRQSQTQAPR